MNRNLSDPSAEALNATLHEAVACHNQGNLARAENLYRSILRVCPRHFDALHLLGVIAAVSGNPAQALELMDQAIAVDPTSAMAHNNRGLALQEMRQWAAALASFDRASALDPHYAEPHYNRGNVFKDTAQWATAIANYDRCIALKPSHADAYCNRGIALMELKQCVGALASFERAIAIRGDFAAAYYSRGNALCELKRFAAALASFDQAIALKADFAEAHANRGVALNELQRFDEALDAWKIALSQKPELGFLPSQIAFAKLRTCEWHGLASDIAQQTASIERGEAHCSPFTVLAWSDSARLQKKAALNWVREKVPAVAAVPPIARYGASDKIHIGYFSADFHDHATAHLIAGVLELHDRSRFRVTAFSFGPESQDDLRKRLAGACDDFVDGRQQSDAGIASLARELAVDIAVDLKGFTQDNRLGVFARRAAPLQVSYLGYPGTSGAPYMDYLVADERLIPEGALNHYSEKILYLPDSYQPNDAKRAVAPRYFTRAELALPPGFVFCCFNNNFKIMPDMFDSWMRILSSVDGSSLWLLEDNPNAVRNLRKQAEARRVDPDRLIFAKRVALADHLARHSAADLFLDTLPYNAHTTASDALWAGLPVLTCAGETFVSRVAASLLFAVGLPELIVSSQEEYEKLAVTLAGEPDRLLRIKRALQVNRLTCPLFDTAAYVNDLEAGYTTIYLRYRQGLPAAHVRVDSARAAQAQKRVRT
jgi:predicted O-linked N-acetylglucosamine transferase (SPINDLY family)